MIWIGNTAPAATEAVEFEQVYFKALFEPGRRLDSARVPLDLQKLVEEVPDWLQELVFYELYGLLFIGKLAFYGAVVELDAEGCPARAQLLGFEGGVLGEERLDDFLLGHEVLGIDHESVALKRINIMIRIMEEPLLLLHQRL